MRLLILADLHLDEITDVELLRVLWEKIASAGRDADALIIAGDLADAAVSHWPGAIGWLGKHYPTQQAVFISGNHDNMCQVRDDSLMIPDYLYIHKLYR